MPVEELAEMVKNDFKEKNLWNDSYDNDRRDWFLSTLELIRDRFHTIPDFAEAGRAYFADDYAVEQKPLKKNVLKYQELRQWLPELAQRFSRLETFNQDTAETATRNLAEELDIKPGILINGMRTVLTGQLAGPSMFDILAALGREKVIDRLSNIEKLYEPTTKE